MHARAAFIAFGPAGIVTLSTTGSALSDAVAYSDGNELLGFTGIPPGEHSVCVENPAINALVVASPARVSRWPH